MLVFAVMIAMSLLPESVAAARSSASGSNLQTSARANQEKLRRTVEQARMDAINDFEYKRNEAQRKFSTTTTGYSRLQTNSYQSGWYQQQNRRSQS